MDDFASFGPLSERLLIVGVDGLVGANLALALSDRTTVLGLYRDQTVELDGCQTAPWKSREPSELDAAIRRHQPKWVVYCGPTACSSWDSLDRAFEGVVESRVVSRLGRLCAQAGIALTVVSTDAVFAGPRLFHNENDAVHSLGPFAQAALQVENALGPTEGLIVRTHAYGWGPVGSETSFACRVWQSLTEGTSCTWDPHRHATPILATDLAELLWLAYRRGLRGVRHVAGAERTSEYRFAGELATVLGLTNRPVPADEGSSEMGFSRETSLDARLAARELGRPMPWLWDGLERFAEQAVNGFRSRFRVSSVSAARRGDAA